MRRPRLTSNQLLRLTAAALPCSTKAQNYQPRLACTQLVMHALCSVLHISSALPGGARGQARCAWCCCRPLAATWLQ